MRVLITGGNGLIATQLTELLLDRGYEVALLSRNPISSTRFKSYLWEVEKGKMNEGAIEGTDYIIHLAGAGIADKRWSKERKTEIIKSRTESIRLIYKSLSENKHQVKACISSGGIGFYGNQGENLMDENSPAGTGFLSESCKEWEKAVFEGEALGLRVAQIRMGMVLSRKGGGLKPLEAVSSFSLGSPLGKGTQWVSWIHIQDICRMFIKAIETENFKGVYNGVAPNPVRNQDFTKALAFAMHKKSFLPPVPSFILKTLMGELSHVVLDSTRVNNDKVLNIPFEFQFKTIEKAFIDLYA
jgi:uncharacterized protein